MNRFETRSKASQIHSLQCMNIGSNNSFSNEFVLLTAMAVARRHPSTTRRGRVRRTGLLSTRVSYSPGITTTPTARWYSPATPSFKTLPCRCLTHPIPQCSSRRHDDASKMKRNLQCQGQFLVTSFRCEVFYASFRCQVWYVNFLFIDSILLCL